MKYSQIIFSVLFVFTISISCKNKAEKEMFFPALSFIQSQIAKVDSSFYAITKIVNKNGILDSSFVKREDFRTLAADFLNMPDISSKKIKKLYKEEKIFDQTLNRVILTYLPLKDNLEIEKLEVVIMPDPAGDRVKNIIIWMNKDEKGVSIIKNLLWQVDESFQIVTLLQKENSSEESIITSVIWNKKEE